MATTKDQLPFSGGTTKPVSGGASGAHDFTQDPSSSKGSGPGDLAASVPQKMGKDDTVCPDSVIEGGKLPFPEMKYQDAGKAGTGSIGNSSKPFKSLK